MTINIPENHPRAASLRRRERIIDACLQDVVAYAGLIAHGRGEAFDYLLGEKTPGIALPAVKAAAAKLILAGRPVLSVNGNVAALCPREMVELAGVCGAALEVNLFYRTPEREQAIKKVLRAAGAGEILGVDPGHSIQIPELQSARRIVDVNGIYKSDVVLVPLEDGDRTEALVKMGKFVITIDLNPLSRTARKANLTIVDDVVRSLQLLLYWTKEYKKLERKQLQDICDNFNNHANLADAVGFISKRLSELAGEL